MSQRGGGLVPPYPARDTDGPAIARSGYGPSGRAQVDALPLRRGPLSGNRGEVDYRSAPAEDYAAARVVLRTPEGKKVLVEASTSWSFVGPGLRLTFELLGPEYSLFVNTLEGRRRSSLAAGYRAKRVKIWWRNRTPNKA